MKKLLALLFAGIIVSGCSVATAPAPKEDSNASIAIQELKTPETNLQ